MVKSVSFWSVRIGFSQTHTKKGVKYRVAAQLNTQIADEVGLDATLDSLIYWMEPGVLEGWGSLKNK